jgi:hypothetical protein
MGPKLGAQALTTPDKAATNATSRRAEVIVSAAGLGGAIIRRRLPKTFDMTLDTNML